MDIQAGDRVRFDVDTRRTLPYPRHEYYGLVGEVDEDGWAWVVWNGGEDFGWFKTSQLEVV